MNACVVDFQDIDKTKLMVVGGKGVNLGELSRIDGIRVPEGFCVTTEAYTRTIGQNEELNVLLDQLSALQVDDRERIGEISGKIRGVIEGAEIAKDLEEEIIRSLSKLGEEHAYAVRSSATAEDLPLASFAGQQDTYLNIKGKEAILQHVSKCWASLFTDRAVIYRMQNGFDHRKVYLSVVIQRLVFPQASGILFTADPVTSNRKVLSIDASFGLGEALVSGRVNADLYKVRDGRVVEKKISTKKLAVYASKEGGTEEREIEPDRQHMQTLTDEQILQLERIGRKIEAYFACPQDIEWCLCEETFSIVQSRPITTLYPIPAVNDGKNHVFTSVGHQQMMTEDIKPLGMSIFPRHFGLLSFPMCTAGGRLFLDVTRDLTSSIGRKILLNIYGQSDLLIKDALSSLIKRKDFIKTLPRGKRSINIDTKALLPSVIQAIKLYRKNDVAIIRSLIAHYEAVIRDMQQRIANLSGNELFDFISQYQKQLKELAFYPPSVGAITAGVFASDWINKNMDKWLGEKNAADTLSKSVSNNITSEMGLALLDVADVVRHYPAVIEYLHHATGETFFEDLAKLEGGDAVSDSIRAYLEKYGMRCPGEIDITKPRWSEKPTALIPMILSNIKTLEPNAHRIKFEQGRLQAERKERDLLSRLEQLPGGKQKAKKTKKMISVLRNFIGEML